MLPTMPGLTRGCLHHTPCAEAGSINFSIVGRGPYRRLMKHAVAAEIRPLSFHDARHMFATWALEGGRSIKWVQERLGHASAELTLRTYAHLIPNEDDELGFLDAPAKKPKLDVVR